MDDKIDFKELFNDMLLLNFSYCYTCTDALQVLKPFLRNKKKYNLKYYLNQKAKKN